MPDDLGLLPAAHVMEEESTSCKVSSVLCAWPGIRHKSKYVNTKNTFPSRIKVYFSETSYKIEMSNRSS